MFELVEVFEQGAFRERIFPLRMAEATIYKPIDRLRYVKHWRAKKQELNAGMQHLGDLPISTASRTISTFTTKSRISSPN